MALDTIMNIADAFNENEQLKPLMDLINQIMEMDDSSLNEQSVGMILGSINGAFTPAITDTAVKSMIQQFEEQGTTRHELITGAETFKQGIQDLIDELKPSKYKKEILIGVFEPIIKMYDIAMTKYHNYDIELPIKLEKGAKAPTYAHETDACADIYALEDMTIPAHSLSNMVHTGIRIALPESWVFLIDPRSSIGLKSGLRLSNSVGIVDEDYRGEICVLYDNISDSDYEIKAGDRIAQCWIQQVHRFKPVEVDTLPETERGEGGFGSTGK